MSWRAPEDSATELVELLRSLGTEPVVAGALAAMRYRRDPRLTTDVDVLVLDASPLPDALRERGYDVTVHAEPGAPPHLLYVRGQGVKLDVLVAETEYQRTAHARAVDGYLAVEDVIVHKLLAWRPRDRDDVASILDVDHELDVDHIERWVAAWGVEDRWERARSRASG